MFKSLTYTFGHCDSFAIALHLLFKYSIYAIMQVFPDENGELDNNKEPINERADCVHYIVKRNEMYLDVEGEHYKHQFSYRRLSIH